MFVKRQTNIGNVTRDLRATLYVVTRTPDDNSNIGGQSYPTLEHCYPTLVLRVRTRGTIVTLPSPTKSPVDLGESYPAAVGLLDVMRAAPQRPAGNTKGMAGCGKSRFEEEIFLTCPSGPGVGTARHYTKGAYLLIY